MTPQEALATLDQAASLAPLNRAGHIAVQRAVAVVDAVLSAAKAPAAPPAETAVPSPPDPAQP